MRILALLLLSAPLLALSACDEAPADPAPVAPGPPAASVAAQMGPGLYAVGDGTQIYSRTRLSEDGSYTDIDEAGEIVGGGAWRNEEEEICFDPEGDGADEGERCWRNDPPDTSGSFMTRRTDGAEEYRVTPLEE